MIFLWYFYRTIIKMHQATSRTNLQTLTSTMPLMLKQQVPPFVIPPRYQGRHMKNSSSLKQREEVTNNLKEKNATIKSNAFMCNLEGQSRSQNRHLVNVYNQKMLESSTGKPLLYDPGLSLGMTLKHIPFTTSQYGFPMLRESASGQADEAVFHQNTITYQHRKRSSAFSCSNGKTRSLTILKSPDERRMSPTSPLQRVSCPVFIRKKSTIAANDIRSSQDVNSSSSKGPSRVVYSNLKEDKICSEEQVSPHTIEFSCIGTPEGTIRVTVHSVCIPSNQDSNESCVCVWIGSLNKKYLRSKQYTKWMPSAFDKMSVLFGDDKEFETPRNWLTSSCILR